MSKARFHAIQSLPGGFAFQRSPLAAAHHVVEVIRKNHSENAVAGRSSGGVLTSRHIDEELWPECAQGKAGSSTSLSFSGGLEKEQTRLMTEVELLLSLIKKDREERWMEVEMLRAHIGKEKAARKWEVKLVLAQAKKKS
ncbi:hypothetical protein BN946_scf184969.g57 [Trametes cinnabarina]|uniref:Uncharacterized protein n=1 Tax=Pycnoporus cinnabarinus TaxID=5643 RepID=A0A060SU93_PYCCI|nr:hypothetical protein BN946_scf184969.g57 [Trametes cinnabarina]